MRDTNGEKNAVEFLQLIILNMHQLYMYIYYNCVYILTIRKCLISQMRKIILQSVYFFIYERSYNTF